MTTKVTVRMYNVGFGDCFLITARSRNNPPWRMLVDCGVHPHGVVTPLSEVVTQLIDDLEADGDGKAHLNVIAATHRHTDHIAGFCEEEWSRVAVDEVWLPFVENAEDEEAKLLRDGIASATRHLDDAVTAGRKQFTRGINRRMVDLAGYQVLNARDNEDAMARLSGQAAGAFATTPKVRYWPHPDQTANTFTTGGGRVTVHVLGPPRDWSRLRKMDPPTSARWLHVVEASAAADGESYALFDDRFEVPAGAISREARRVLKIARLSNLETAQSLLLATSRLDRVLNNTSLFMVLEIEGVKIVLPGDAQEGAWQHAMSTPENRELLRDCDLYKIGHHGSHNASPRAFIEDGWNAGGYAMLPWGLVKQWKDTIPKGSLMDAIGSGHTVVRMDNPETDDANVTFQAPMWSEVSLSGG